MNSPLAKSLEDHQVAAIQEAINPTVAEAVDLTSPETTATALVKTAVAITNPSIVRAILKVQCPE